MKKLLFIIPVIISLVLVAKGYDKPIVEGEGIKFHNGTWAEAVQKAKKENKLIFLDISASWCGPCKMLKAYTFPNSEVGAYFNKNFINVEVDGEEGEGIELAAKYHIRGYPSLIFIDKDEKVIEETAGYRPPDAFIGLGKSALAKMK
jgi:thioredoxin 1